MAAYMYVLLFSTDRSVDQGLHFPLSQSACIKQSLITPMLILMTIDPAFEQFHKLQWSR